jgi:hypothetical protein
MHTNRIRRTLTSTTALVAFSGLACFGQQLQVKMDPATATRHIDKGLIGDKAMKPSHDFSGKPEMPTGPLAEGLQGSPAQKPARAVDPSQQTNIVSIKEAHAAQFEEGSEAVTNKSKVAAMAAKARLNATTFDPRASLTTPPDGSVLAPTQLFAWTAGYNAAEYYLWVGSCFECKDILDANQGLHTSTYGTIPTDGRLVYATLFSYIGGNWYYFDYQFVAPTSVTPAFMTSPANGSTLDSPQTFSWSAGVNVASYALRIGSCLDCGDLLDENEGLSLSRTTTLPLDGRTVFVTLFTNIRGIWYYIDYQYRAGYGNPVRVFVTNNLDYPLNIYINGASVGSVSAGNTQYASALVDSMEVSFSLAQPTLSGRTLGDPLSGYFNRIYNASGDYSFTVTNIIGADWYFKPLISNRTYANLDIDVNGGLQAENKCSCYAPAYTENLATGYYRLFGNTNVRLYVAGANYTGPYRFFGQDADGTIAPSGLLYKLVAPNSGLLQLIDTIAP